MTSENSGRGGDEAMDVRVGGIFREERDRRQRPAIEALTSGAGQSPGERDESTISRFSKNKPGVTHAALAYIDLLGGYVKNFQAWNIDMSGRVPRAFHETLVYVGGVVSARPAQASEMRDTLAAGAVAAGHEFEAFLPTDFDAQDWRGSDLKPGDDEFILEANVPVNYKTIRLALDRRERAPASGPAWTTRAIRDAGGDIQYFQTVVRPGRLPGDTSAEYHRVFALVKMLPGFKWNALIDALTVSRASHRGDKLTSEGHLVVTRFDVPADDQNYEIWIP